MTIQAICQYKSKLSNIISKHLYNEHATSNVTGETSSIDSGKCVCSLKSLLGSFEISI